jgi:hypothetical protein
VLRQHLNSVHERPGTHAARQVPVALYGDRVRLLHRACRRCPCTF